MTNTNLASARVVVIGAFPPPVEGMSMVTEFVAKRIEKSCLMYTTNISPGRLQWNKNIFYHARRASKIARGIVMIILNANNNKPILYLPVDNGYGMLYAIGLVTIARLFRYRIFLHHHSYAYIDERMSRMSLLTKCAGALTHHIMLCRNMKNSFSELYPAAQKFLTVSNAALVKPVERKPSRRSRSLRLGYLSNLSIEKGLDVVIDVLAALLDKGVSATLVLAGPPATVEANVLIKKAQSKFGASLDYRGAVYGTPKEQFFEDIDVFLFPTRNESFGIVNLEALSYGVPSIAYARGCIPSILAEGGGKCIDPKEDFVAASLPILVGWVTSPDRLESASVAAWKRFQYLCNESSEQFEELVTVISEVPSKNLPRGTYEIGDFG